MMSDRARSIGILFAALGGLVAPLMPFVSRAPTVLVTVGAVGGAILLWRRGGRPALPDRCLLWLLAGLLAWSALSALWAIDASEALSSTAKLAGNLSIGILFVAVATDVNPDEAKLAVRLLATGCLLSIAFMAFEILAGAPLSARIVGSRFDADIFAAQLAIYGAYWFNAAISLLTLMIWPLLANGRRLSPLILAGLPLTVILLAHAIGYSTGALAVLMGVLAAFLVWRWSRWGRRLLAALLACGILIAPVLPRTILNPERMSEMTGVVPTYDLPRFYIWAFAAERSAERPLLGWGMNASRSIPGGKERITDHARDKLFGEVMPLHPHNVALQVWLELGLVGALLLASLVARLIMHYTAPPLAPRIAAAATGLTVTALVQFALSYSAWQSWWLASVFLAAAFLAVAARRSDSD